MTPSPLPRRDALWVLRRCGRKGHQLAWLADPLAGEMQRTGQPPPLLRCLRCGSFTATSDPAVAAVIGTEQEPVALADIPLAVRGSHGRKLALLRVVAIERVLRALMLLIGGAWRRLIVERLSTGRTFPAPSPEWAARKRRLRLSPVHMRASGQLLSAVQRAQVVTRR